MGWYFWAPAVPFLVLLFTPLRWPAILASAAGLAAGLAVAQAVGLVAWPALGMAVLLNLSMAIAEGVTAALFARGRIVASVAGAAAAHGALIYLVWRELSGRWALAFFLIPAALLGGAAAVAAAALSRR